MFLSRAGIPWCSTAPAVSYTPSHWSVLAWCDGDCESEALLLPWPGGMNGKFIKIRIFKKKDVVSKNTLKEKN